jgi:hypothetical protein
MVTMVTMMFTRPLVGTTMMFTRPLVGTTMRSMRSMMLLVVMMRMLVSVVLVPPHDPVVFLLLLSSKSFSRKEGFEFKGFLLMLALAEAVCGLDSDCEDDGEEE